MKKPDNLDNRVLNSLKKAGRAIKHAAEATADAISDVPVTAKTAVIGTTMLAALAGAPGVANAQSTKAPADWQATYTAHAKQAESTPAYKMAHPGDMLTGPTQAEVHTAAKLMACYAGQAFDIPALYKLTRSPTSLASHMSGEVQFSRPADSRVDFNAPVKGCQIEFGMTPLKLWTYAGHTLDESLEHWVTGQKGFSFQADSYFSSADAVKQSKVLQAMREAVSVMELDPAFAATRSKNGFVAIPHEIYLKGVEAMMGLYTPAPAEVAAPVAPPVVITKITPAPEPIVVPAPVVPEKAAPIEAAVPAPVVPEKVAPVETAAPAPVVPEAVAEVAPEPVAPPNPCDDPQFQDSLDDVADNYNDQMDDHVPVADIEAAADVSYDLLESDCPDNADRIQGARDALAEVLTQYTTELANRVHFNLFDIEAGMHGGGHLVAPSTADGHLHLAWATDEDAPSPFNASLYLLGGNELLEDIDGGEIETPFGGALVNFGGENYQLRLSLNGNWFRQTSAHPLTTTPFGPDTYDIEGGTETISGEEAHSDSSITTGNPLENWYASGEALIDIGNFELQLGAGFGQFLRSEESRTHVYNLTDVMQDSSDMGPPASSVHTVAGSETFVDTLTLTDVLTNLLGLRLAGGWNFDAAGGHWLAGADAQYFHNWSEVTGSTEVTHLTNIADTITDVNIDGLPPEQIVVPGEAGEAQTITTPHDIETAHQGNLTIRGRVLYDRDNLALRLELGPVFQFDSDGYAGAAPLGVAGNLTAIGQIPQGQIFGGNIESNGTELNMDALFASGADFQYFVGYVDMVNQLRQASLIDDQLRENYLNNLFDHLVETNEGFIVSGGPRFQSEGMEHTSGHAAVAYSHLFPNMGPLGASVQFDSEDMSVTGTGYIGLTHGLNLRISYETSEHDLGGREHAGFIGLAWHPQMDDE